MYTLTWNTVEYIHWMLRGWVSWFTCTCLGSAAQLSYLPEDVNYINSVYLNMCLTIRLVCNHTPNFPCKQVIYQTLQLVAVETITLNQLELCIKTIVRVVTWYVSMQWALS